MKTNEKQSTENIVSKILYKAKYHWPLKD